MKLLLGTQISAIRLVLLTSALVFCGCKVGPSHFRPNSDHLPASYTDSANSRLNGEPVNEVVWWEVFNDPSLDGLIRTALAQNLGLKEAGQRILEARAIRQVAAGNLFPQQQSVNGSYNRIRISENDANFVTVPGFFETDTSFSSFNTNFAAAWELDFWGKYRRMVEAADAKVGASMAGYDLVKVMLIGEVAKTYVELRTVEKRMELARKNVEIQGATLLLADKKLEAGTANKLDYHQSKAILAQTAATLPELEILRRQACHRMCVLLGLPPGDIHSIDEERGRIPTAPRQVATGIPADLLRRRPDVQLAERELAAQSARIGIAKADFYPQISLSGAIGVGAANFDDLFRSSSLVGRVGPAFSWNILNYGRIKNRVIAEEEGWERLVLAYHAAVLKAYQEVQDAQISFIKLTDREIDLNVSVESSLEAVKISQTAFAEGATDFDRVYLLQSELVRQQDSLVENQGRIALSLVNLYVAMGGGWDVSGCDTVGSSQISALTPHPHSQPVQKPFCETRPKSESYPISNLPRMPVNSERQPRVAMAVQSKPQATQRFRPSEENQGDSIFDLSMIASSDGKKSDQSLQTNFKTDSTATSAVVVPDENPSKVVWESQTSGTMSSKDLPKDLPKGADVKVSATSVSAQRLR